MENIDIQRCCKKTGDRSRCSLPAEWEVYIKRKKTGQKHVSFRCDAHKSSSTVASKVIDHREFVQQGKTASCLTFLHSHIGKKRYIRYCNRLLTVKFVKPDKMIAMAQDERDKWYAIYPNQF